MLAGISVEKHLSMDLKFLHFLQAEEIMVHLPDSFYKNVCKEKNSWNTRKGHPSTEKDIFIVQYNKEWASQVAQVVKNPPLNAGDIRDWGSSLDQKDSLEEGKATHSSILF